MTESMDIKKLKSEMRMKTVKSVVGFAVTCLVEAFMSATTNVIVGRIDTDSRLAKLGVRAGGFLTGMYIGNQVTDHILGSIDETLNGIEELKKSMEEE